jgi:hypothetical protein
MKKITSIGLAFVGLLTISLATADAAPVRNFSPIIKNSAKQAGNCTTRCYPTGGGGQTCHTSCF